MPAVRNNVGNGIYNGVELRREEEEMRFKFCHVPCLIQSKDSDRIVLCLKRVEVEVFVVRCGVVLGHF